jgi:hypothetical protein
MDPTPRLGPGWRTLGWVLVAIGAALSCLGMMVAFGVLT